MLQENKPLTGQNGLYATAAFDKQTSEIILKLVNTSDKIQNNSIVLQTSKKVLPKAMLTVLKSEKLDGMNTIDNPEVIKPVSQETILKGKNIQMSVAPYSFTVLRIKIQ
jgi:alpha-L-arabinofuranosidase